MAIVYMNKRIEEFFKQLEFEGEVFKPEVTYFDYDDSKEVYKFDEEVILSLRDFEIEFDLLIEQTGVYDPGDDYCVPPEFTVEETFVEIHHLIVFDNVYGEELRFNREEFTDLIQKVKNLIEI